MLTSNATIANVTSRRTHLHQVTEVRLLSETTYCLRCERSGLQFAAGQCANLGVPGVGINREYSTYAGESDPDLEFLIKEVDGGIVSRQLRKLKPGDDVELHGFYGDFQVKTRNDGRPHWFIGTGTGVAPFRSFVRSHPDLDYRVIHGVRYLSERYDRDNYESGRYLSCVSREDGGTIRGHVTDYLKLCPVDRDAVCYLCGNRAMISETYRLLRAQGIDSDRIYSECFF